MAGKGIADLRPPTRRCSPVGKANFETREDAAREDRKRARLLRAQAAAYPTLAAELLDLADKLEPKVGRVRKTLASSLYTRKHRIRITGALWRLHELHGDQPRTFTLMPPDLVFAPEQLSGVDPRQLLNRVRGALLRTSAKHADGFLFLYLHGEYDPLTDRFHLHFHGYGMGRMLAAVDELRDQAWFTRQPTDGQPNSGPTVRIDRAPLTNLPAPLTYVIQSWWPARDRGRGDNGVGHEHDNPRRGRIPEPAHSQWLLWMDRWRIQDMVLMMNLRVVNGKLRPRK